jgi:glycosyltransferase involved in cell wall biosynthesis
MCDGLRKAGAQIRLFFATPQQEATGIAETIQRQYGVATEGLRLCPVAIHSPRGISPRIAALAAWSWVSDWLSKCAPEAIYSRNLYASLLVACFCPGRLIYETHQIEEGFRASLQGFVLRRRGVLTIVISEALKILLVERHSCDATSVMVEHDGVNDELINANPKFLGGSVPVTSNRLQVGYFGHLYRGRGIEVILVLAARFPDADFWVYGGTDDLVRDFQKSCKLVNCHFGGFVPHAKVISLMRDMDVLLMPYQESVAIEASGKSDTSRYMSPMKMFEYMASGVPMIASRLPVLQEVLQDQHNCLLAAPRDVAQWEASLRALAEDNGLRKRLASNALNDVRSRYTWVARASSVLRHFKERAAK